jgi:hypothetical protein
VSFWPLLWCFTSALLARQAKLYLANIYHRQCTKMGSVVIQESIGNPIKGT